ncbi:hypothetical protein ACGFYZ_40255 [Streptomyces sp. NPDC048330]|uniref:hypothetical protein n=1 Tax=Streptomyces sp. NPDC048330 TaxID=3365533 RepID=UPI00371C3771
MGTPRIDDIQVAQARLADGEIELGPDGDRTVETIKVATLRFAADRAPYDRRHGGNMLTTAPEAGAQLLRVESMTWEYRYDHEFGMWWATAIEAETVYAEERGIDVSPRREQTMGCWGENSELTPQWVKRLVDEYRPAPEEVPPPPRKKSLC